MQKKVREGQINVFSTEGKENFDKQKAGVFRGVPQNLERG